jgi:hypothetical protein
VGEYGRVREATDRNILRRTRFAWWIDEATNIHSEYVILTPFPRQQWLCEHYLVKVKVILQQGEVARGFLGWLRPRIFLTFGTKRVVVRQPYAPVAFTQEKSMVLILRGWVVPSGGATDKIPSDISGNRSRDRLTSSAVPSPLCYSSPPPHCLALFLNLVCSYYCIHYIWN